jgi:CRISPR-associated exonuclease Cas4
MPVAISRPNPNATMSFSLPVHLLRQHRFCPRVPWFQELLNFKPPQPQWVRQGVAFHQHQESVFRHRTLKRFGLEQASKHFHLPVQSGRWQMHGIVDCALETETAVYAVEIKMAGRKPAKGHILQVVAYGLLLADMRAKPCPRAFVVIEQRGKTWPVEIMPSHIDQVIRIRNEILNNLERACMPDSAATDAQCTQCEYLNHCNDRH